jgi:hypothetical protein
VDNDEVVDTVVFLWQAADYQEKGVPNQLYRGKGDWRN